MHRPLIDALIVRLALSEQFSSIKTLLSEPDALKKKDELTPEDSEEAPITEEAVAAPAEVPPEAPTEIASEAPADDAEENIYDVMKQTMLRQKQEQDAKNAQWRQGGGNTPGQRPGPPGYGRPQAPNGTPAPAAPVIKRVTDLTDLLAVWSAARQYLAANARLLESVLGPCTRIKSLTLDPAEALVLIPNNQERFTNEKAQGKLEEALRAVTGLTLKLRVEFVEPPEGTIGTTPGGPGMPNAGSDNASSSRRVPPELMEAVNKQPIVLELMKRLDAVVTLVEMTEQSTPE